MLCPVRGHLSIAVFAGDVHLDSGGWKQYIKGLVGSSHALWRTRPMASFGEQGPTGVLKVWQKFQLGPCAPEQLLREKVSGSLLRRPLSV